MTLTPPKWVNVLIKSPTITPESLTPPTRSKKPPKLSNLSDPERELLSRTSPPVKPPLLCSTNKKLPLEPKEPKTLKISSPDKNKPSSSLTLLRSSSQNLEPSPHTPLLRSSLSSPNSVPPTQSPLSSKSPLLLTVPPLPSASVSSNNSRLISPLSLTKMSKLRSKPRLTSIT